MLFYALTGLINAITSTFLGIVIYFKNRKEAVNQGFSLFCLSVAIWSYGYYFWQVSTNASSALFWTRVLMGGAIFIPFCYFHFVLAFLGKIREKKKFLIFSYFIPFLFLVLDFTPLFVKEVTPELSFQFWPKPGITYHPFLIIWMFYLVYCTYLLSIAYKKSIGIKRVQIKYILSGITIGFIGGSTNYFLWYGIPIPPVGNVLVVAYVLLTAFAIAEYHLMNIQVILSEFLVALVGFILLIDVFLAGSFSTKLLKSGIFISFCYIGYLLIQNVFREIKRREEIERISKDLEKAYKELKKIDESKSEFISIASHQLRTPLTAIKGYISMIHDRTYGIPPEKMEKPLRHIYISAERLIKLVSELLNISRIEAGKVRAELEISSLEYIINSVITELKSLVKEKDLYLEFKKGKEPLPKISIDKEKMRQVILNIIDNAIRYTKEGGITVRCKKKENTYQVKVSDTGEGMTKREISDLFKSFSRGKAGKKGWVEGAGLGLYIAKKYVDMHKGKIWAKSQGKGKGSSFYIELPIQ